MIAHEGSTLIVVFNALRLLAFREVAFAGQKPNGEDLEA